MVIKEIYEHLILYNIIRRMLREESPVKKVIFPPYSTKVQANPSMVKGPYVDKLGRSFSKWNAGRHKKFIEKR